MTRTLPAWLAPAPDSVVSSRLQQGKSPWVDAVHVLWSVWVFITPMMGGSGYDLRWTLLTLASYPLFLLLYAAILLRPRRETRRYALGMVALSMALLKVYPSGMSYFVFGCVLLGTCRVRFVHYLAQVLLLNAAFVGYALWIGYPRQMLVWMPVMTMIIGFIVSVERINEEKDAALKLSHDEVRRLAATAERERIGRDLHDLLGHTLSLIALKSELAGKLLRRGGDRTQHADAAREIDDVSRVARDALAQVRAAVTGIRAAGMAAELASARLLLECDGIALRYAFDDRSIDGSALPPRVETALALTVREAVTNIQRHARARSADIAFETADGEAVLRIHDDGRGGAIVPGNGLGGMRERIEALGGRLRVDSASGHGTRIEACIPLAANDDVGAPAA